VLVQSLGTRLSGVWAGRIEFSLDCRRLTLRRIILRVFSTLLSRRFQWLCRLTLELSED